MHVPFAGSRAHDASSAHARGRETSLSGNRANVVDMTGNAGASQAGQGVDDDLTEASSLEALTPACAAVGLDSTGARLLRLGEHAVFRLAAPVVVRVGRSRSYETAARTEIAVARWLEREDYPAVRAVSVVQPQVVHNKVVTFWATLADDGTDYGSVAEVANLLKRLHAMSAPSNLGLEELRPFGRAGRRISQATWLNNDDRDFLHHRQEQLGADYQHLSFALPAGIIHGDASVGNVIRDTGGRAVLIDLDGFALGPREWDLVVTAMYYDSFGWHSKDEYQDFARIYGFDVMTWDGYPVLRDIREFLMVTWLAQKGASDARSAAEVRKRISALRTGASRKDWRPF